MGQVLNNELTTLCITTPPDFIDPNIDGITFVELKDSSSYMVPHKLYMVTVNAVAYDVSVKDTVHDESYYFLNNVAFVFRLQSGRIVYMEIVDKINGVLHRIIDEFDYKDSLPLIAELSVNDDLLNEYCSKVIYDEELFDKLEIDYLIDDNYAWIFDTDFPKLPDSLKKHMMCN